MEITEKIKALPDDRRILIYEDDLAENWFTEFDTTDLKTLIEQQSAVIEEAEKALEDARGESEPYSRTCRGCRGAYNRLTASLARIQQIRDKAIVEGGGAGD